VFNILQTIEEMPNQLMGPGTWQQCMERACEIVAAHEEVTAEIRKTLELDGGYSSEEVGGGVYILQAEEFSTDGKPAGREKATLSLTVDFNPKETDGEALACALDQLMDTTLSTPGILEEYGDVSVGKFLVEEDQKV
jgi:hypothetical protein